MMLASEHASEADVARRLRATIFSEAPMGIALTAPDGRFLEANAAYCRLVGYSLQELRRLDLLTITHADDRAENRQRLEAAMAREPGAFSWDKRYIHKGGDNVSVRGRISVIRDDAHHLVPIVAVFEDLYAHDAVSEDLRRSQALVEIAGRVAQVGGWSVDLADRRLVWSDVVAAIHDEPAGFSPTLAQGINYFVPEHREVVRTAFELCVTAGTPYDLELEKVTARGRRIWVRTIGQAERDAHGQIVRLQGAFQEISSLKQNELAARDLAERLRATLESITDAFCTLDSDWRFTYANRQTQQLLDQPLEPLLGRNVWAVSSPLVGPLFERELRRARDESTPVHFEEFHAGLNRWFAVTADPSSQGLAVYFRDVSSVRAARQRLELLEASVSQLNDIILITEARPLDEPGPRIMYANEAFTRITGHALEDVLESSPRLLQGPLTDRSELDRIRAALSRSDPVHSELVNYTKAGEPYWIELDIVPVAIGGETCSHFVAIERDVTERKRAQKVLHDNEERLRFLHDLAEATRRLTEPTQVMATTVQMLAEHLRASRGVHTEADDDTGEGFALLNDKPEGGAVVVRDVDCRWLAMLAVHQAVPGDWTVGEVALIEESVERSWTVAERLGAEERLREGSALLRIAGHTARLGGWAVDLPQLRVTWSDQACAILDAPAGAAPSLDVAFDLYAAHSRALVSQAFDDCAHRGIPFDLELELTTLQGRAIQVRCAGEAQADAGGIVTRVHGALQDITERHKAEAALRASTEEFRTLTEAMPQIVWITRPDGDNIYTNQQWADYTGLTREQTMGAGWGAAFHPEDRQRAVDAWGHATATKGLYEVESRMRRADGEYRWWLARALPLLDSAGDIVKWIGTCTDVHDLKQAELRIADVNEALRESERRFSDVLRTVRLLSVMLDTEARVTYCSDYVLSLTGWRRDEVIGQNWFERFAPHRASLAMVKFAEFIANPVDSWNHESRIVTRSGEHRLIRWNNSVLRSGAGLVVGAASIGEDITERKHDQIALRDLNAELESRVNARTAQLSQAREEADQANHAKSAFLAAMSHEIRTPMNGVIGMIDVLQQTSLKSQQQEMVDLIRDSAFSLLAIIEDILDLSKIEAGKMELFIEAMQLGDVIEKGCGLLTPMAAKRGVRLTVFIDPAIPHIVHGDEGRVRQVLVNLVSNAIKFSGGHHQPGRISVRALRVDRQAPGVSVDLVVADNGIGMNDATLARLFTPFAQADASTTRRFGGTGLGLAISDMLVRLMEGAISVRSAPGNGSTFTVRLHFATPQNPPVDDSGPSRVEGLRCRIVGGERPLGDDLEACLQVAGVAVERAQDLDAAAAAVPTKGLSLWLILPSPQVPALSELRAMAPATLDTQTRFVILGQGAQRRPCVEAPDLVTIDVDALARHTLLEVLALAAGRVAKDAVDAEHNPMDTAATDLPRPEAQLTGQLILVAEDNETNCKVILRQLQLMGFAAEVCLNGREALERWRSGEFALLLTDLHMPEMDGYELAAAVRAEERPGHYTPIIALTANALRGEEQHCLAIGMDGYLTKPVRLPQLKASIEAWLDPAIQANALQARMRASAEASSPVDLRVLVEFVGDDPAVIDEVLHAFGESATQSGAELDQAFKRGSMQAVADAAHKLKSAARSIGGSGLGQLCADIEAAARAGRAHEVSPLLPRFRTELRAVHGFLSAR